MTLRQIGLREPSGQTHSKCGDMANSVENAVNQTVDVNSHFPQQEAIFGSYRAGPTGTTPIR